MADSITTVKGRAALEPRHPPYWHHLQKGWAVGFQKTSATAPGTWKARYVDESNKSTVKSLGRLEEVTPAERFDAAKGAAEVWLKHMSRGGSAKPHAVQEMAEASSAAATVARQRRQGIWTAMGPLVRQDCYGVKQAEARAYWLEQRSCLGDP